MATTEARMRSGATHVVTNQAPPLEDYNVFEADTALVEAVEREGADWARARISEVGEIAGRAETIRWGMEANQNVPRLKTHDRYGNRVDEVEFHPSWHQLMSVAIRHGIHTSPWSEPGPGSHVARAANFICIAQTDAGICCPISGTYAAIPAIRQPPEIAAEWEAPFEVNEYDQRPIPVPEKAGAVCCMGMTEKQGGSDVRANTSRAMPINGGGPGAEYEITGHKWFFSAPMCDTFLVLAQAGGGVSCFFMPRWTPDGERNGMHLQRLKDKLGNRSNASSEVEFRGAWARMIGEEGSGVPTIIEMVNHTRLDCTIGSTAGMRAGVAMAIHHTSQRSAFGKLLADAFCASRLDGDWGGAFGTLPKGTEFARIVERHAPTV